MEISENLKILTYSNIGKENCLIWHWLLKVILSCEINFECFDMNKKLIFYILFFICFGITTEVFFTAITDFVAGEGSLRLMGHTYVWMAFIYALIPILFMNVYPKIAHFSLPIRLLIFVGVIYMIEFSAGFLLEQLTGSCPWEYTTGWHIMGYIRLDYALFWAGFGFLLERLFLFLEELVD